MSRVEKYGNYVDFSNSSISTFVNNDDIDIIQNPYRTLILRILDNIKVSSLFNNIISIYLRGSLVYGKKFDWTDIDWIIVYEGTLNQPKLKSFFQHKTKMIPTIKHDINSISLDEFWENNETYNKTDVRSKTLLQIKYFSKHLYGKDFRDDIRDYDTYDLLYLQHNFKLYTPFPSLNHFIQHYIDNGIINDTESELQRISKRCLRQLFNDYVFGKHLIYTHDIYYAHHFLVKYYPEYEDIFNDLFNFIIYSELYTRKRTDEVKIIFEKLIEFCNTH